MPTITPALMIKTIPLPDGGYRSDWRTKERQGYILTRPPNCRSRRALAELLALHAVTGLVRPLRFRDFQDCGPIRLTAWEIPETIAGSTESAYLRPYVRFIRLSLNDLPIELMRVEDWPSTPHPGFMESFELVRNDPWEDVVHFSSQFKAAPTILALDIIRAQLRTTTQWKAWATLYLTASDMIRLPSDGLPTEQLTTHQFLCPKYGWIFIVKDNRIVGIRGARAGEHQSILGILLAQQPALEEKAIASAATYAIREAKSSVERLRILDEFLCALPERFRRVFRADNVQERHTGLHQVMKEALDVAADQTARASMLRVLLQALPAEESHLELPDGTRASVTGHVLDRLMTRFNMRSALSSLRWLHSNTRKLRPAQLSPLLQASKALNYDASAIHWRHFNEWTIVVSEGVVMTAYFPKWDSR